MTQQAKTEYNDVCVQWMVYPALLFLLVGMLTGLFISLNGFLLPDYFSGQYVQFGRMRPVHVGTVLMLWLLSANVGLLYFLVPRLCGVSIWSPKLGIVGAILWWFFLIAGNFSYPLGTNWGWEYAELPFWVGWIPVKLGFVAAWILISINLFMTIAHRRYEKMYVSLWYTMGTLLWTTITVYVGWFHLLLLPGGMSKVNANFFYVHNLVGLVFTPMGLAIAYYFLPKLTNTPIYSHRLSMIGFWALAFSYSWIGAHHIIHGPVSQWLQTTAILFSMWLIIPVLTVVYNLFGTLKGQWHKFTESIPVRFLLMGTLFYLVTCIQGPLMALRNVNEITSKTDWIIGHSHISLFATFSFFVYGGIYYVLPILAKKPIRSPALTEWHYHLSIWGSILFILPLWIGGFVQGLQWANWAQGTSYAEYVHNISSLPFMETVAQMRPWWFLRTLGGAAVFAGAFCFVVNVFNTLFLAARDTEEKALA